MSTFDREIVLFFPILLKFPIVGARKLTFDLFAC